MRASKTVVIPSLIGVVDELSLNANGEARGVSLPRFVTFFGLV